MHGIVRCVDDLGRIVLPKELRHKMGIRDGTRMNIFLSKETIILKKYYPESEISDMAKVMMEAVEECDDLELEKTEAIRQHLQEVQALLAHIN